MEQNQQDKDTQDCFDTDDGEEAITRVRALVKKYDGSKCAPKFVLLNQPDCVPCEEAHKRFADGIKDGTIKSVAFDSPEGLEIMTKNDISEVPSLLLVDCLNNVIHSEAEAENEEESV